MNITLTPAAVESLYRIRELEIVLEGLQSQLSNATDPVIVDSLQNAFNDLAHLDATLRLSVIGELVVNLN